MKKLKKIAFFLIVLIIIGFLSLKFVSNKIVSNAEALPVKEINFEQIEDGQYIGNYEIFPVKVSVRVSIQNGEITQIDLLEHFNGKGIPAEKIVDHIIEKQSSQVDSISGATVSSIAIKKAVEDSLLGK
ncbi:MAG: FMN-binding protein [Eubacteriaceae bacterium]|nr:FMN-binding protein [Eubacteriaceae bacterium]